MACFDMKALALASIVLASSSWAAWGCERSMELDSDQVRHDIDLLKSGDADELDQIDVLGALMCAERPSVRDLAARTALSSPNESVQAGMLLEVLFQKQNIVVEFIEEKETSNEVRDFIQEKIALNYEFRSFDRNASCIVLENSTCSDFFLDVTGKRVEITYGSDLRSFSLDEKGELQGYYKPYGISAEIPARIKLL